MTFNKFKLSKSVVNPGGDTAARVSGDDTKDINKSEGKVQKWLIFVALIGVPILFFVLYYKLMFVGLVNINAFDYAQIGRNLSEGHGFTTYFLRPLALTHGDNPLRQADVVHGPLFPLLLAFVFAVRGATDAAAASVSAVFFVLTVPVVYLFGVKIFSRNVALFAAFIFAANPLMLEYAISGLPITLQAFLMTCLFLAVYQIAVYTRDEGTSTSVGFPRGALIWSGILTGGLYLSDSVYLYLVPVITVAVLSLLKQQRGKFFLYFALPLLGLLLPWMTRLALLTGNPFFGLRGMDLWARTTQFYPGDIVYRHTPIDLAPSVGLFNAILRKILLGAGDVIQTFPHVSGSWTLAFLLPSLLFRFRDSATTAVRRVLMYCFAAIFIGVLPFGVDMPLFLGLIPTMLIFSIAYLLHLIEQSRLSRPSIILLISLLGATVVLPMLRSTVLAERPVGAPSRGVARMLKEIVGRDEVVLTDQPWLVAWYADRPAIWIPAVDDKVKTYRTRFPKLRWLFLTDQVAGFSPEWQFIYSNFAQWNIEYAKAMNGMGPMPKTKTLSGDTFPLATSLKGVATTPPLQQIPLTYVVTGIPE